jgi:DNA-3-methyladenine glycosylase II
MYKTNLILEATPPFDFHLSAHIFREGDPQIRSYNSGIFWQVLNLDGHLALIKVESIGNVEIPKLTVEFISNKKLSNKKQKKASELVASILNLQLNLLPFYLDIASDDVMNSLSKRLRGLKSSTTSTIFESLVDSIVEQQISLKAAHSIENRVIKNFGDFINFEEETYYAYPSPDDLAGLDLQELRDCGLSFRKSEYVRDLSQSILDNDLDLEGLRDSHETSEIIDELCKIRGVGVWTAELTVIRSISRFDAMPADDIGLRRAISHFYRQDQRISAGEAREIANHWGKWKGLAGYYLIVAELTNIMS